MLLRESKIQRKLYGPGIFSVIIGIPKVIWSGSEDNYNIMVQELLGPSIQDLFEYSGSKFPMPIILSIAKQLVYYMLIL